LDVRVVADPAGPEGLRSWLFEASVWRLSVALGGVSVRSLVNARRLLLLLLVWSFWDLVVVLSPPRVELVDVGPLRFS
jgi:hypothetical protein